MPRLAGLSQAYWARGADDKAIALDMRTFVEIFESPEPFIRRLRKTAGELAKRWNDTQGGSKCVGQRKQVEKTFKITECKFNYFGTFEATSRIILNVTSFVATQEMNDHADARILPSHFRVALKMVTTLPPGGARPADARFRMTRFGVYLPLKQFETFMTSKEMKEAVAAAKSFLGKDMPAPTTFVMTSAGQAVEEEAGKEGEGGDGAAAGGKGDAAGSEGGISGEGKAAGRAGGSKGGKAGGGKTSPAKAGGKSGAEGEGETGDPEKRKLRPANKKMRYYESPEEQALAEEEDYYNEEEEDDDENAELIDIGDDDEEEEEEEGSKKKDVRKRKKKE